MPTLVNVTCVNCQKTFSFPLKRYNESTKKGWNFYCSRKCRGRVENFSQLPLSQKKTLASNERITKRKRSPKFCGSPELFARRRTAEDGHICDSFSEILIDNWLFSYGISHEINVSYPGHSHFTADFVVGDYWIEFFGLSGEVRKYDRNVARKLVLAKKYKLRLIKLYPKDLFPWNHLDELLAPVVYQHAKSFVLV